jgi:hypothetical protein
MKQVRTWLRQRGLEIAMVAIGPKRVITLTLVASQGDVFDLPLSADLLLHRPQEAVDLAAERLLWRRRLWWRPEPA